MSKASQVYQRAVEQAARYEASIARQKKSIDLLMKERAELRAHLHMAHKSLAPPGSENPGEDGRDYCEGCGPNWRQSDASASS